MSGKKGENVSQTRRRIVPAQPVPDTGPRHAPVASPASQRTFFFVDDKSSSKGKRAHVMKHHIQEKKKEQRRLLSQVVVAQGARGARALPWTRKPDEPSQPAADTNKTHTFALRTMTPVVWTEDTDKKNDAPLPVKAPPAPTHSGCLLCHQFTISASRTDPFCTLPMDITDESQQLVDCWTKKLAYWSGQNTHMKIAGFKQAILNPMTFHVAILTYCARYKAHVFGAEQTPQSIQYLSTAERSLARYIANASDPYDQNIIMAFAALSLQEERYGCKEKAMKLVNQAMVRLRPRAGQYHFQDVYVHYVRYTMSPRGTVRNPADAHLLLSFLRSAESAAQDHQFISQIPIREEIFQFSTPLHLLLSSGPQPSHVPNEERKWVVKYGSLHDFCRIASLIYITAALLDYRGSADRTARFLEQLLERVDQHRLNRWPSTETLVWMLLEEPASPDLKNPQRAWLVGDMLEVVRKLPWQLNYQFSELLLRYLMLRPPDLEISLSRFERDLWAHLSPQEAVPTIFG
ncbi:predicted protein [Uncinocarpus reesii 1704]|uniref:Uncharacterized protein n=1 Tax=Uncinocarpus reesii (strain UAMH 1704) TaxID=336963 RepID=C4JDC6_UNCRE|nr:uncharacterized protein UREG_00686 [Uncinocarpus reesii 1704]EEP75839.1 predicted protein [Uncinocarpus reesii 1704]